MPVEASSRRSRQHTAPHCGRSSARRSPKAFGHGPAESGAVRRARLAVVAVHEWREHAVCISDGLHRDVRLIRTGSGSLYMSLYAAADPRPDGLRLAVCPAWHADGDYGFEIAHHVCAGAALNGGVAATFHWPGHGESDGDPRTLRMHQLVAAGEAVLDEVIADHGPGVVAVAGVQVGAVPAVAVARSRQADRLVLVEPDLDADAHFAAVERTARRTSLGKDRPPGWAASRFVPHHLREAPVPVAPLLPSDPTRVTRSAVIRYEASTPIGLQDVEEVVVPGNRRRRSPDHHLALREAAVDWLNRTQGGADA